MLSPQDPGVMAASLNIFYDMCLEDPLQFKDLAASFVSILKQIIEHRLPRDFDYHKVRATTSRWLDRRGEKNGMASHCSVSIIHGLPSPGAGAGALAPD